MYCNTTREPMGLPIKIAQATEYAVGQAPNWLHVRIVIYQNPFECIRLIFAAAHSLPLGFKLCSKGVSGKYQPGYPNNHGTTNYQSAIVSWIIYHTPPCMAQKSPERHTLIDS